MTTDIIELNDFIVLIEQSKSPTPVVQQCSVDGDVIGFAFYGSGEIEMEIRHNGMTKLETSTTGMAISFFGNENVEFVHKIGARQPLQSISVFTKIKNLHALPTAEQQIFEEQLPELLHPRESFVKGPTICMNAEMRDVVQKMFTTSYHGNTRLLFLKSQVTELLAHFFALLSSEKTRSIPDADKLYHAKQIMIENMSKPPSLNELASVIGMNSNKLKKNFKELFGVPVFKYLHDERLKKAYELLTTSDQGVQEVSWYVGYESVSSFSNAFQKKYNLRPIELRQQFLLNKS